MSLRLKTIIGIGLIEAILLIILITTVLNYMQTSNKESLENYVKTTSTLFTTATKDAVLSLDLATLNSFTNEILKNKGVVYIKIFDAENNLLASGGDPELLQNEFANDKSYDDVDDNIYNVNNTISVEGIDYGQIEIGISTKKIESNFNKAKKLAGTIALTEMLLVALFSYGLGIYLTRQLKTLKNSASLIASGNLEQSININSNDEIGDLAKSFNKMILSLKKANKKSLQYLDEVNSLNKSLEKRVESRTQELAKQKNQLEETIKKLNLTQEQLIQSEKMASIGQLAAGVAHEINNPVAFIKSNLTSLKNYASTYQILLEKQENFINLTTVSEALSPLLKDIEDFKKEEDMNFIKSDIDNLIEESIDGSGRVEEIVRGLKAYARASDEKFEEHDINDCINKTLKLLNNELKHHCIVETNLQTLPKTIINEGKISQVIANLIINAVQAIDKDGIISISTMPGDEKSIKITISDNGTGISKENLSKLFDPFFTTKEVGKGTGLGLSISQGIIHEHGGSITVTSVENEGTTFTIILPTNAENSRQSSRP